MGSKDILNKKYHFVCIIIQISAMLQSDDEDGQSQEWQTCCSRSNERFVKYMAQVSIGLVVIVICMFAILTKQCEGESNEFWIALLFGTVGTFMPHPTMKEVRRNSNPLQPPPA